MKRFIAPLIVILSLFFILGCNNASNGPHSNKYGKANIKGGVAVAIGNETASRNSNSTHGVKRSLNEEHIFTIFEDGTYAKAFQFDTESNSIFRPKIEFIMVSKGLLYAKIMDWSGGLGLYAFDIETEEVFKARLPDDVSGDYRDLHHQSYHGFIDAKPLTSDKNGNIYFVFREKGNSDRLAYWNPRIDPTVNFKTPYIKGNLIWHFQITDDDIIYIYGLVSPDDKFHYLQVLNPASPRARYIYHENVNNEWIKSATAVGSSLIINNHGNQDNDGIFKIESKIVNGELDFTFTPLFNNYYHEGIRIFDISYLVTLGDGSVWGVNDYRVYDDSNSGVVKILDVNGNPDFKFISTCDTDGTNVKATKIKFFGDKVFYLYPGRITGTHEMAALNLNSPETPIDLTKNMDEDFMTIFEYSVTPSHVYFSGWDGITPLSCSINIETLEFNILTEDLSIDFIEALHYL